MGKEQRVTVRFAPEEYAAIRAGAETAGLTLSAFIRKVVAGRRIASVVDGQMVAELRRLGAMLKHRYPREANWTVEEKRRYWQEYERILALAAALEEKVGKRRRG